MENLSQQEIERHVSATFDSVELIKRLKQVATPTQLEIDSINRNQEHLRLMLTKKWFVDALTKTQKTQINNVLV